MAWKPKTQRWGGAPASPPPPTKAKAPRGTAGPALSTLFAMVVRQIDNRSLPEPRALTREDRKQWKLTVQSIKVAKQTAKRLTEQLQKAGFDLSYEGDLIVSREGRYQQEKVLRTAKQGAREKVAALKLQAYLDMESLDDAGKHAYIVKLKQTMDALLKEL